jgi:NTE family protein
LVAKVPILLINATALNNGHNWRFEASTMGEPRADDEVSMDIDKSIRLRPPSSYDAMIKRQQDVELGLAVAASACVPGIFNPLAISDLYPDIRVELVDGGVHDNQGVQGLIDLDYCCDLLIVSDGSGQMHDDDNPRTWLAAVLNRSQSIFMKRVREEPMRRVLKDWSGRVAFFHLREGIAPRISRWNAENGMPGGEPEQEPQSECGSFGVSDEVQALLSKIRTDLDSFTEVEAYSLMLDGYLVSNHALSRTEAFQRQARAPREPDSEDWEFMKIRPWIEKPTSQYLMHLRAAGSQFFKIFKLNTPMAAGVMALLAGIEDVNVADDREIHVGLELNGMLAHSPQGHVAHAEMGPGNIEYVRYGTFHSPSLDDDRLPVGRAAADGNPIGQDDQHVVEGVGAVF